MIERYTLPEMGALWTELHKKTMWFKVELAALYAKELHGDIPRDVHNVAVMIEITEEILKRADEIELITEQDLIAFVLAVTERLEEIANKSSLLGIDTELAKAAMSSFHGGLTSYDIEDTALALILRDGLTLIKERLAHLRGVLLKRAKEYRDTLQIGRTHFVHAEPITFGFKLLGWVDVIEHHLKRLNLVSEEVNVGKFSGAVGMYVLDPEIERLACRYLGLQPAKISTQILSRDLLVHLTAILVGAANSLDRFATEIRHLSGTDISEVAEFKKAGAKASSAMPGKTMLRNSIKSENVCGSARVARGYLTPAFECEVVWGERTLENSAAERIYLPDLFILLDFMLKRFADTMEKLEVFPEQMERNVWRTGGIVFAQRVMMKLTEKGMARHEAYDLLEKLALSVKRGTFRTEKDESFRDLVYDNETITKLISWRELDECFDPKFALKHIDAIFARFDL